MVSKGAADEGLGRPSGFLGVCKGSSVPANKVRGDMNGKGPGKMGVCADTGALNNEKRQVC